jgi:2'-5' RNA ligase
MALRADFRRVKSSLPEYMRLFVATFLGSENRAYYDRWLQRLAEHTGGLLRPIPPSTAHLTHVFIGEADAAVVAGVADDLRRAVGHFRPVQFQLEPPTILRAGRTPRLVCAHVGRGSRETAALSRRVAEALSARAELAGARPSRSPHVTIARFRRNAGPAEALRVTHALDELAAGARDDTADRVAIVSSVLTGQGPVYDVVAEVCLQRETV